LPIFFIFFAQISKVFREQEFDAGGLRDGLPHAHLEELDLESIL
jgi:hypothetical protein